MCEYNSLCQSGFVRSHAAKGNAWGLPGRGSQLGPEPLPISVISTCRGLRCPTPEQDSFHSCLDVPTQCLHTAQERGRWLCSRSQQRDEEGRALVCAASLGLLVGTEAESFLPLISLHFLNYSYLASVRKQVNENYRNGLPASRPLRERKRLHMVSCSGGMTDTHIYKNNDKSQEFRAGLPTPSRGLKCQVIAP